MLLRHHPAVDGKKDVYPIDPRALKVDPTYNVRDMNDPETIEHVRWLADSIKENGVRVPLEIRKVGDDIFVVAGHCRLAAVMLAIKEGATVDRVLCVPEDTRTTNDVERTLNLVISNSGKPLTPLAIAEVVRRLLNFGWDNEKIAARFGKSLATVDNYIALLGADSDVHAMVRAGTVSASTASKVVKKEGSKAGSTLKAAVVKGKVTAKTLRASKGEFEPNSKNVAMLVSYVRTVAMGSSGLKKSAGELLDKLGIAA